ncbi:MAG: SNF2-related protein [Pirellulales bacterium]
MSKPLNTADFAITATPCAAARRFANAAGLMADSKLPASAGAQRQISIGATDFEIAPSGLVSATFKASPIQTMGCLFVERGAGSREQGVRTAEDRRPALPAPRPLLPASRTRIRPPRDVVKLADRLRLLLEPPLEALLACGSLRMARPPFAFQLDGVAFLYPRQEAVLADEMGLGKTMQAITTLRLLVHQGHVRRVLLVCPKPLVNNWQREFAIWAPELSITVVAGGGGDSALASRPTRRQRRV